MLMCATLGAAAADSTFIHAYLLIAGPGQKVYNVFGHTFIRLECPSKGLDYCFSFEIDTDKSGSIDFMQGKSKAGFVAVETPTFTKQYTDEGRSVVQYELNLTHHEKQELWRTLDQMIEKGSCWTFDYYNINCSSMAITAIEDALDGRRLQFTKLNDVFDGDYNDCVDYIAENSPWARIFWRAVIIGRGSTYKGELTSRMAPRLLAESLPGAVLTDTTGRSVPLVMKGGRKVVAPQLIDDKPFWLTPAVAGIMVLAIAALLTALIIQRKRKPNNK